MLIYYMTTIIANVFYADFNVHLTNAPHFAAPTSCKILRKKKSIQTCYTAHVRVVRTVMVKSS